MIYTRQAGSPRAFFSGENTEVVMGSTTAGSLLFYLTTDGTSAGDPLYSQALITSVCSVQAGKTYTHSVVSDDATGECRVDVREPDGDIPVDGTLVRVTVQCVPA